MKIMVGYDNSPSAERALRLACKAAKKENDALVYVVTSLQVNSEKAMPDVAFFERKLQLAREYLNEEKVSCETLLLTNSLSPGENLLKFANDIEADHIFIGIEKKSRASKLLLGSTAQYIILRGSCPVTTTK